MLDTRWWFTLIETLLWVLIVSFVIVAWFQVLSDVWVGKIQLIEKTKIEKQAYFASEKFFEMIKKGGTIDYEEYWNRSSYSTWFTDGYYTDRTGFWNFWDNRPTVWNTNYGRGPYHCLSKVGNNMWTNGCLLDYNIRNWWWSTHEDKRGPQRYMQYSNQFIDRNSDEDGNIWDENGDGEFMGDADDLFIWIGPKAFSGIVLSSDENRVWELYLINTQKAQRTIFRWNITDDPNAPASASCDRTTTPYSPTWDGCLWTIEYLQLVGEDYGYDHDLWTQDGNGSQGDGILDTWLIHNDFTIDGSTPVAGSSGTEYWQKIFPDSLHVSNVEFHLYPNKDLEYSWRDVSSSIQVAPYVQVQITLTPSWKEKRKITSTIPSVDIISTIQLSQLDFR